MTVVGFSSVPGVIGVPGFSSFTGELLVFPDFSSCPLTSVGLFVHASTGVLVVEVKTNYDVTSVLWSNVGTVYQKVDEFSLASGFAIW